MGGVNLTRGMGEPTYGLSGLGGASWRLGGSRSCTKDSVARNSGLNSGNFLVVSYTSLCMRPHYVD